MNNEDIIVEQVEDTSIEQSTLIEHERLREASEEWLKETGAANMDEHVRSVLVGAFADGWSRCMEKTMRPATDLAMILLQVMALQDKNGMGVTLSVDALQSLRDLCNKIVGMPEQWQLNTVVELVDIKESQEESETGGRGKGASADGHGV
jgi:hypothetical protein